MPLFLKNRVVQVVLGVVVVALLVTGAVLTLRPKDTTAEPAVTTSATPSHQVMESVQPTPEAEPSPTPTPVQTCTNFTGEMESPTKFVVERMGVDSKMIVVGDDEEGNPGAPPPNEAYTTAWYNHSPAPGTTKGNVILTIHTYSKGQALGNDLYGKQGLTGEKPGLEVGDLIKVSDDEGHQICYRYTGSTKVWVDTYDPESGVFHNLDGPPQLAIMICWDYIANQNFWDSRIIFYAALIPEGVPA